MTASLRVTVLVDNTTITDRYFCGEPGLSIFIETGGKKILFDTGYSGLFLENAKKMGIDLHTLDLVVLSHGHLDHTGGLVALARFFMEAAIEKKPCHKPGLLAHPRCFRPKEHAPLENNGSILDEAEVRRHFAVTLSDKPIQITDDLVFLGEIPRKFPFEQMDPKDRRILLPDGTTEPDLLLDDTALACRTKKGLVIITGCSHAGICNITEYAREVCGEEKIHDIVGGFHLLRPSPEQLQGTCAYLKGIAPAAVHACHCTSLAAKIALAGSCPVQETGVGLRLEW